MANCLEEKCGGLLFTSNFDSGNLARVERVPKEEDSGVGDSGKISHEDITYAMYIDVNV